MLCTRADSGTVASDQDKISDGQNVLRGASLVLRPRLIFTAGSPGDYRCWLGIGSGRPRPASPDTDPGSNVYQVASGSYLEATTSLDPSAAQGYAPSTPSHVLEGDDAYDAAVLNWTAPAAVNELKVSGDVQLTACTVFDEGTAEVSTSSGCGRSFRIKVYVKHLGGSAVVVHSRGTITAVIPTR